MFPSLKPNRREDVLLLQHWLTEMLAHVTPGAGAGAGGGSGGATPQLPAAAALLRPTSSDGLPPSPTELADGALYVYGVAFDELKRQVGG